VGRLADMSRFSNYFSSLADLMGTNAPVDAEVETED